MPYSSDQDASRRFSHGAPDPFASLGAAPPRRRFWLIELLMAPFQDHDERAAYRVAKKNSMAKNANGTSGGATNGYAAASGVARNGNGGNGHGNGYANGHPASNGFVSAPNGNGNGSAGGLFSAGARRSL